MKDAHNFKYEIQYYYKFMLSKCIKKLPSELNDCYIQIKST